ncbi:hypothetical protein C8R44DRAFT_894293 [Mycena epipterygia]|nr:hypothetical protein C8R44DRAFT_894293 [Mycena epipterygia]
MAFYGQFAPTSGPNDPQIPTLTPQQYAIAFQHFHYQQQMQMLAPPQQPLLSLPGPVIDPSLQSPQVPTTDERLHALELEMQELKAQKRSSSDTNEGSSKRPKKANKPSPYILRNSKGLSKKQLEVRSQLMRKVKSELRQLTGTTNEQDSNIDSDDSDTSPVPTSRPTLAFDFSANVDDPANIKVIERAVHLVWTEQHNSKSTMFSLPHADVQFTREDLAKFSKTIFRGWKRTWKEETDPELAKKKAEAESKGRQNMRRKELKATRIKAVPQYKKQHKRDPAFVLETDWISDEVSGPETDDEDKKTEHRRRLVQAARLGPNHQDDPVWERIRPGFQSTELSDIKDTLDSITTANRKGHKRRARPSVPRVNLGNTHNRLPSGIVWPFMVSQDWYDATVEGHEELESELQMYTTDPKGFGGEP